jgi:hypothetical protein
VTSEWWIDKDKYSFFKWDSKSHSQRPSHQDLCLRPRGHWDRLLSFIHSLKVLTKHHNVPEACFTSVITWEVGSLSEFVSTFDNRLHEDGNKIIFRNVLKSRNQSNETRHEMQTFHFHVAVTADTFKYFNCWTTTNYHVVFDLFWLTILVRLATLSSTSRYAKLYYYDLLCLSQVSWWL